jgi:hypothetical protein
MLLAIAVLFLAANTFAPKRPPVKAMATVTVTPKPTLMPSPTPNALLLDKNKVRLVLHNNDPDKLSAGNPGAVAYLEQQIKANIAHLGLQNRRAGIAIAYGGADNVSQIGRAVDVAIEVYKVLDLLGSQKFVFCKTVHYDPLFSLLYSHDVVLIDIYFFDKSVGGCSNVT